MIKTIVITGASDGVGAAAARQLHQDGHRVIVVGRSRKKLRWLPGRSAQTTTLLTLPTIADFAHLEDVRELASALASGYPHINVPANNAGGFFSDPAKTEDGSLKDREGAEAEALHRDRYLPAERLYVAEVAPAEGFVGGDRDARGLLSFGQNLEEP